MPAPLPQKPVIRKKNRKRNQMLITVGILATLALTLILMLLLSGQGGKVPTEPLPAQVTKGEPKRPLTTEPPFLDAEPAQPSGPTLVDDDGRTLWASPTDGPAILLDYVPPGCDLILHMRPAALLDSKQGYLSLSALGPQGAKLVQQLEEAAGLALVQIDELLIGVRGNQTGSLEAALVIRPNTALSTKAGEIEPPARYRSARTAEHEGVKYRVGSPWCCFAPPFERGALYVVALRPAMQEVLEGGGTAPPLRREIESLVAASDRDRHVTLVTAPSFLFSQGRGLFSGAAEALRDPVFEFLPDTVRAGSLSLHWGDAFYLEARADPAPEITAKRLAALIDSRLGKWSNDLQLAVLDLNPAPHGRRVVAQLPAMTRLLSQYARFGAAHNVAIVNAYLPATAGQNLLAGSELMLAQLSAGAVGSNRTTVTPAPQAVRIAEKLRQPASVSFARDTLEMAVAYLADEIDAPIVILGADLQLEGITKNQSFGMDATEKPAGAILLDILTKANPDKTAIGPTDPKQKLVYVVKQDIQSVETIYVTTRAAALKRGDKIPAVFTK